MSRVEFHVVRDTSRVTTPTVVCRLAQEHYHSGRNVYIRAADGKQASRLDDLLWTFDQGSFIPHRLEEDRRTPAPVIIGRALPESAPEVFINLAPEIPPDCQRFPWILEVVDPDPKETESARERFRRYRELGCELSTRDV